MYAFVAVPRPLPEPLLYEIPDALAAQVAIGSVVRVPFRSKDIEGYVVGITAAPQFVGEPYKIKSISEVLIAEPVFQDLDLKFFQWIADYYQVGLGEVFFSAFPKMILKPQSTRKPKGLKTAQKDPDEIPLCLTEDQNNALDQIRESLAQATSKSYLLFGVTGSGKTEVYIRSAKAALSQGRSSIIMVPEIALTPQLRARFEEHFGEEVAVMHSSLSEGARKQYWWDLLHGKRRIVVGARSAIFAPIKNLGLIVVDEEHEPSYKQEGHLRYHARDLALVRARLHGAVTILGSATPSVETYFAAANGKHKILELRTRPASRPMPEITVVDLTLVEEGKVASPDKKERMRQALMPKTMISPALIEGLETTLMQGEQAMVFLNRKGYSNFLLCVDCGYSTHCEHCSVSLTYYQSRRMVRCHYCGHTENAPDICPQCAGRNLKYMGFGTESIEQELRKILPHAKIERLDAETASTVGKLEDILNRFRSGEIQILVGTQMLAKGHDFPNVTLIGVVLAEMGLHLPDFRAGERTFQLLSQVSGRAGRGDKPGRVLLQTYSPSHYVIQCALTHNYQAFYEEEIKIRKEFGYPPFSRMAQLEFRHRNEQLAEREAQRTAQLVQHLDAKGLEFLGPAPASVAKVADCYRWQMLLKSEKISSLNALVKTLRKEGVRFIDVDPISTL